MSEDARRGFFGNSSSSDETRCIFITNFKIEKNVLFFIRNIIFNHVWSTMSQSDFATVLETRFCHPSPYSTWEFSLKRQDTLPTIIDNQEFQNILLTLA